MRRSRLKGMAALLAPVMLVTAAHSAAAAAEPPQRIVVFPFEIIIEDTLVGIPMAQPADVKRLALLTAEIREMLKASGKYEVVDTTPIAAEIEKMSPFFKCNACETELAKKVGATLTLTGLVQKGSASAANITFGMRDVATDAFVRTGGITVLESSDEGWLRGLRRVVKSRLTEEGAGK